TVSVRVRNTGPRAGTEVVQLYLHDVVAQVTRPVRQLTGFARVHLEPGATARVRFRVHADRTAFTGRDLRRVVEPGEPDVVARRADAPGRGTAGARSIVELIFHGPLTAYCMEILQGVLDAGVEAGVTVAVSARERGERSPREHTAAWARDLASAGRQAVVAV